MKRYIVFVETYDILPHSVSYTCDENTLETTLRVARETKGLTNVSIQEITPSDVEEVARVKERFEDKAFNREKN